MPPPRRRRVGLVLAAVGAVALLAAACIPNPVPSIVSVRRPVYTGDFPDPSVLHVGSDYYAYSTNVWLYRTQVLHSTDLVHWDFVGDALRKQGPWAADVLGRTWAPDVVQFGDTFVEYYSAQDSTTGLQCVGRATSDAPAGPFVDNSAKPLVCQFKAGGTIDPSVFTDTDGRVHLLFKSDTNAPHAGPAEPTALWSMPLSADGLDAGGAPVELMDSTGGTPGFQWHNTIVEAPAMVLQDGNYWLFYSGMKSDWTDYGIGFARCDGPVGPCTDKTPDFPWMTKTTTTVGVGGQSFFRDASGQLMMAYHALIDPTSPTTGRDLYIERIDLGPDGPLLGNQAPLSLHAQ